MDTAPHTSTPALRSTARAHPQRHAATAWAAVGLAFLAFQAWVFARWLADGNLHAVRPAGHHISTGRQIFLWSLQATVALALIACAVHVVRQCRRQGRITYDAALFTGYLTTAWQDPILNYTGLAVLENRYALNLTSWGPYLPGWHGQPGQAVTVLAGSGAAYGLFILWYWIGTFILARIPRRRPRWRPLTLLAATVLACLCAGLVVVPWTLAGAWSWTSAFAGPVLFAGHWYQVPLAELVLLPLLCTTPVVWMAALAREHTTEPHLFRGSEHWTPHTRPAVRLLAGIGLANATVFLYYASIALLTTGGGTPAPDTPGFLLPVH
ncbi:spirocyclase AveC family protein [Streptomyces sp. MNP-20]|uniref:spirocyclase AveC family protein n=1 Tax=Streptomyces sp. MNP-20 TaxID=2721165 RepID=UPI001557BCB2|nr:spirocyclase AveC family protein [Streptomyces sp. MNP-20]